MTVTTLNDLRGKHPFRYSTVAQRINECSRDIDHYLECCTVSGLYREKLIAPFRYPFQDAGRHAHASDDGSVSRLYPTTCKEQDYGGSPDRCGRKKARSFYGLCKVL